MSRFYSAQIVIVTVQSVFVEAFFFTVFNTIEPWSAICFEICLPGQRSKHALIMSAVNRI